MSLETIRKELEEMGVEYEKRNARMTNTPELVIPMENISGSQARQIEFLCTSNSGIVSKKSDNWVVTNL